MPVVPFGPGGWCGTHHHSDLSADLNVDDVVRCTDGGSDRELILHNIGGVVPTLIRTEQLP